MYRAGPTLTPQQREWDWQRLLRDEMQKRAVVSDVLRALVAALDDGDVSIVTETNDWLVCCAGEPATYWHKEAKHAPDCALVAARRLLEGGA